MVPREVESVEFKFWAYRIVAIETAMMLVRELLALRLHRIFTAEPYRNELIGNCCEKIPGQVTTSPPANAASRVINAAMMYSSL
jgi:hypothetical protein